MTWQTQPNMRIGVLALQGAFIEHAEHLERLKAEKGWGVDELEVVLVKTKEELELCQGLIIPGGESTVLLSLASLTPGLLPLLTSLMRDPSFPVFGTCAGMIMMADEDGVGGGRVRGSQGGVKKGQKGLGAIPGMRVWRNAYGSQLESFELPLSFAHLSSPDIPFPGIFIRAPAVHSFLPSSATKPSSTMIETLSRVSPEDCPPPPPSDDTPFGPSDPEALGIVALRYGKKMCCSFHPELSSDLRVHEYFVEKVCARTK